MSFIRFMILIAVSAMMLGCTAPASTKKSFPVTSIVINKGERKMYLMNDNTVLRKYKVALGFAPKGHKQFVGDGKTPEGRYWIDRKNPYSEFHLSLGISYPNAQDRQFALKHGKSPGGDIFIHGQEKPGVLNYADWTAGCIAVSNKDIEEIYRSVPVRTPVFIRP